VGRDLSVLVRLVATGALLPPVGWRGPWQRFADATHALRARQVAGKAVLDVTPID